MKAGDRLNWSSLSAPDNLSRNQNKLREGRPWPKANHPSRSSAPAWAGLRPPSTLRAAGFDVQVYEQAAALRAHRRRHPDDAELVKVLRGIGVEEQLRQIAFEPYSHLNRDWDTGEVKRELPMPESLYGAPFLCMHRADLHEALDSVVPAEIIHLGKKLVGLDQADGRRHAVASPTAPGPRPMR